MNIAIAPSDLSLSQHFLSTRQKTDDLCAPLGVEDYGLQADAFTSPVKWHIAHTSWFFETFLLKPFSPRSDDLLKCLPNHSDYSVLFNSYYHAVGKQHPRPHRHLLSRPKLEIILQYRKIITEQIVNLLEQTEHPNYQQIQDRVRLGIEHEKQHQELILMDLKYNFYCNPIKPCYLVDKLPRSAQTPIRYEKIAEQTLPAGYRSNDFCFDNETPVHSVILASYQIADRLSNNQEYADFIADGGYTDPLLWLSDGWAWRQANNVESPLYWQKINDQWYEFSLYGLQTLDPHSPVSHISYYEADAFARWSQQRLATEYEWEAYATHHSQAEAESTSDYLQPINKQNANDLFAQTWQWTSSSYSPYPGFTASEGAIGEYNGKFMCNQMVLRGSCSLTPSRHSRISYRNFFYPNDRWQMSGIRLAK
ncbi:MAG: ergothioneine biosynthesis protein EgtB [Kangiellaceae bacterium]|jgi:ergothioneine biosynthesis protein EgtB|nr:ergothioneine biosynthesis protein EgtB [Kangiellaceae bacterium]